MKLMHWVVVALITTFATPVFANQPAPAPSKNAMNLPSPVIDEQQRMLFDYVLDFVKQWHYNKPNSKDLINAAIRGMLRSLDPHSSYVSPEDAQRSMENLSGNFVGIGAIVQQDKKRNNVVTVVRPIEGGPADKAGIKAGDIIDEVDGRPTSLMNLKGAVNLIRGKEGTVVKLKIIRKDVKMFISVTRARVDQPVVRSERLRDGVGFIYLDQFVPQSAKQIRLALDKMQKDKPLKGLILDLRYNPGGLLTQAIEIVDMFSSKGTAVSVKDKDDKVNAKYDVTEEVYIPEDMPMVILINRYSASASEIVAGSLKQMGRAIVIGEKSFGKGSVQSVIPLYNGGRLMLTMQHYFTANDTTPQDVGIEPNLKVDNDPKTTVKRPGEVSFDNQLRAAINYILSNSTNKTPKTDK